MLTLKTALGPLAVIAVVFALTGVTSSYAQEKSPTDHSDSEMKQCMAMMSRTGDADADFMRNMIPHHQMAIDMAKEELNKGNNHEAREMAQKIIDAQTKEISTLLTWMKAHKE